MSEVELEELNGTQDPVIANENEMNSANSRGLLSNEVIGDSVQEDTGSSRPEGTPLSFKSYISSSSFLELIACLIFLFAGLVLESDIDPRQRPMPFQQLETGEYVVNQVFNETFDGETVSTLIQGVLSYFAGNKNLIHRSACVYIAGAGLTILLTNSIKLYVGYLRPIFFDMCEPDDDYTTCTSGDDRQIRLSFPSGHASSAFCGLALLSFFLERHFGFSSLQVLVHDPLRGQIFLAYKSPVHLRRIVSIFCYSPLLLAGFIAASRVVDNKHFPADVVGGSVLGTGIAALVHSLWFPSWPCLERN